jgi:hypothetical protein
MKASPALTGGAKLIFYLPYLSLLFLPLRKTSRRGGRRGDLDEGEDEEEMPDK